MSRYSIHPMEQKFQDWEKERREYRTRYWQALYLMRSEYLGENKGVYDLTARPTMHYWAEEKYGIVMGINGEGQYTDEFTVKDPKKFMWFQLKYWK